MLTRTGFVLRRTSQGREGEPPCWVMFAWVALGLLAILVAASRVGYWLGLRARDDQTEKSRATTWQAALLALSALLIGFTFSMAQARFDARKKILLAEANSIGTTYLRTRMLDDAAGEELRALLRRYVDARLAYAESGSDRQRIDEALRQSATLEDQIWSHVVAAGRADRHSVMTSLLVQSTNDMFDAVAAHIAAVESPLPVAVFLVLILATTAATASIGFGCGLDKRASAHGMVAVPLLLAAVILLVFDLAHPRIGILRARDPILIQLRQHL
jgi:hypothetical protein